jgi:hypothetical protein
MHVPREFNGFCKFIVHTEHGGSKSKMKWNKNTRAGDEFVFN